MPYFTRLVAAATVHCTAPRNVQSNVQHGSQQEMCEFVFYVLALIPSVRPVVAAPSSASMYVLVYPLAVASPSNSLKWLAQCLSCLRRQQQQNINTSLCEYIGSEARPLLLHIAMRPSICPSVRLCVRPSVVELRPPPLTEDITLRTVDFFIAIVLIFFSICCCCCCCLSDHCT
ncbi:unnamed protein product [Ceratitis capitata]|uniref:(Mediterranean fruit fly) hypothetical protein n=1 Tax=Ceratitis capitata TaxID=7213 RepID=A0A811VEC7_CERCA|nr:unnamed protein product [Ceratitis capitata]